MTTVFLHRPSFAWRAPLAAALLAGSMAALAGCTTNDVKAVEPFGSAPDDYRTNHPIAVQEGVQSLDVPIGIYTDQLTDAIKSNIVAFAQKYKASGSSVIAVVAPSGSPDQAVAADIAVQVENTLRGAGVAPGAIDYRVYSAASDERNAPIRIAYSAVIAQTAPCGLYQDQLSVTKENTAYFDFGCATQQNLAAVVDNPLDLLYPRGLTSADAARRSAVLAKYRTGTSFSADHSQVSGGTVAQGIGQ